MVCFGATLKAARPGVMQSCHGNQAICCNEEAGSTDAATLSMYTNEYVSSLSMLTVVFGWCYGDDYLSKEKRWSNVFLQRYVVLETLRTKAVASRFMENLAVQPMTSRWGNSAKLCRFDHELCEKKTTQHPDPDPSRYCRGWYSPTEKHMGTVSGCFGRNGNHPSWGLKWMIWLWELVLIYGGLKRCMLVAFIR